MSHLISSHCALNVESEKVNLENTLLYTFRNRIHFMNSGKKVCSGGKKILEKIILKSLEKRKRKTVFLKVDGLLENFETP